MYEKNILIGVGVFIIVITAGNFAGAEFMAHCRDNLKDGWFPNVTVDVVGHICEFSRALTVIMLIAGCAVAYKKGWFTPKETPVPL